MRGWRAFGVAAAAGVASVVFLGAVLEFLAPDLGYRIEDRVAESLSGKAGHTYRIALGSQTGSSYRAATVLNRYLKMHAGYEIELVSRPAGGSAVAALLEGEAPFDFAIVDTVNDEAIEADGVVALAALESQYFFVIVPNDSPVREFRDLVGAVNPGTRDVGPPTLGERVLDYYGMVPTRVSIVRPQLSSNVADFEAGLMIAATRTQFLNSELIDNIMRGGGYRLVPIRDHDALARSLPGTRPGFIPAGLYGPERRIPAEPVPTITVQQLLVARSDVPARVVGNVLEALYDPRFAREVQYDISETTGRDVGGLPLHPAAEIFYHRNDLLTSDRLGRLSFVASLVAALFAVYQFVTHARRNERVRARRRLLGLELAKLETIRRKIEAASDAGAARGVAREADDLLSAAEREAAVDLLDPAGIDSLRSLHRLCWHAADQRGASVATDPPATTGADARVEDTPPAGAAIAD